MLGISKLPSCRMHIGFTAPRRAKYNAMRSLSYRGGSMRRAWLFNNVCVTCLYSPFH